MSEQEKEYIEIRLFFLGDGGVGKRSFIKRILNLPSTSEVRNYEAEEEYEKIMQQINEKKKKEKQKEMEMNQQIIANQIQSTEKGKTKEKTDKLVTTKSNFEKTTKKFDEDSRTTSRIGGLNEKTNKNLTGTTHNLKTTLGGKNTGSPSKGSLPLSVDSIEEKYIRPPVPEYPAKLYNIYKSKLLIKPFFIPPAEELPYDFVPRDDEDSEYELEKEHKISLKRVKQDLSEKLTFKDTFISSENLGGYKISVYTLLVFFYDMSNFYSFESLILYYSTIARTFHLSDEENMRACIIGNKKDKQVFMDDEQKNTFNEFLKNTQLKTFEVSTKPFFHFDKFFLEFFYKMFSDYNEKLFNNNLFKSGLENILNTKPNFSKAIREQNFENGIPGPKYDINLYSFNNTADLREVMTNKKMRFSKKIFVCKQGPIIYRSKSVKDLYEKTKDEKTRPYIAQTKGGLLNKPVEGFSMGIVQGHFNLIKERKDLKKIRNKDIEEFVDINSTGLTKSQIKRIRDDKYFKDVLQRKNILHTSLLAERHTKFEKILQQHENNLKKIEIEKEASRSNIFSNQKISSSKDYANPLLGSLTSDDEQQNSIFINRARYHEVIYKKNSDYLEKYNIKRAQILDSQIIPIYPGPNSYDVRQNFSNPKKGITILGKRKEIESGKIDPKMIKFKDDFDKIAENVNNNKITFKERFPKIEKEKDHGLYIDEIKQKKRDLNHEPNERTKNLINYLSKRKEKMEEHQLIMEKIQDNYEQLRNMRRDILIKKGYDDGNPIKDINYSLVEDASPSYSLKGRYNMKTTADDDIGNMLVGNNLEMLDYIKNAQKNSLLPNFNYIRPKLPNIIFSKAERFPQKKCFYEENNNLFPNGVFAPLSREDFSIKEQMSNNAQRGIFTFKNEKRPSPNDYKIKSEFEKIVEEGKHISATRSKIQLKKNQELIKSASASNLELLKNNNKNLKKFKTIEQEKNNETDIVNSSQN